MTNSDRYNTCAAARVEQTERIDALLFLRPSYRVRQRPCDRRCRRIISDFSCLQAADVDPDGVRESDEQLRREARISIAATIAMINIDERLEVGQHSKTAKKFGA